MYSKLTERQQRVKYDYAFIKLNEKVPSDDFISLGTQIQKGEKLAIYGYPKQKYSQWGLTMTDLHVEIQRKKNYISYSISTEEGQSGSPIIKINGDDLTLIGIHKGICPLKYNWGRLITQQLIEQLRKWVVQVKAEMFRLQSQDYEQQQKKLQMLDSKPVLGREVAEKEALIGIQLHVNKCYKLAAERYIESIRHDPKYNVPYNKLRELFNQADHISKKQILYECQQKQAKNPKDFMGNYLYASALRLITNLDQSKIYYRKAIQINPNFSPAYNGLGIILYKTGNLDEAMMVLEYVIQMDPKYPYPYTNLSDVYKYKKLKQKAMSILRRYMQLNPSDQQALEKKKDLQDLK